MTNAGVVVQLVQLLQYDDDALVLVMASRLLQMLASIQTTDPEIMLAFAKIVQPLVELLESGSVLAQEEAAVTLGILATCSDDVKTAIVRAGAAEQLVVRLRGDNMQATAAL